MAKIVDASTLIFRGRCCVCDCISEDTISNLSATIVRTQKYSFCHVSCPACSNLMALYPTSTFNELEKNRKRGLTESESAV